MDNPDRPFRHAHSLSNGAKVVVEGTESRDWSGDHDEKYTLSLQLPGQKMETVAKVKTRLSEGGEPSLEPKGPFRLQSQGKYWLFTEGRSFFVRPKSGGSWLEHPLMADRTLAYWGRATRPDSYALNECLVPNDTYYWIGRYLPARPHYVFERWDSKKRIVVLHTTAPRFGSWNNPARWLWPRRLVFQNWKFSPQKTVALEPKWKLRPFPRGVKVEITALNFANLRDAPTFFRVEEAAKVRGARLLWKNTRAISTSSLTLPIKHWWTQKSPTTLQIRGVCADPNPQLLHFQWRVGQGDWLWTVARQNQQLELRKPEGGGSVLEASYYHYARFRWPERRMKAE